MIDFINRLLKRDTADNNYEFLMYIMISLFCTTVFLVLYVFINAITNGNYLFANGIAYFTSL